MVYQKLKNLDSYYKECTGDKIILNDVKYFSLEEREKINNALMTVYDSSSISMVPSCDCGLRKGGYLLGRVCSACSTTVRDIGDKTDPLLWLHALDDMPNFISPHFWIMMKNVMGKRIDGMRWLSDTSYNPPVGVFDFLIAMKNSIPGFERSYPYLVNNIETILIYMQNHSAFKIPNKKLLLDGIIDLYRRDKKIIFSYHLPIVNKKLFVMENTSKGKYTSLGIADVMDTVLQFVRTVNDPKLTLNKRSNAMARIISDLANLYQYYYKEYLSRKPGVYRKHIYGGRSHFTFRAVITSIPGPHHYDEVHVPWSIGVTVFRPHLLNLLIKEGLTPKKASRLLFNAVNNYDPLIEKVLNLLITNSKTPGRIPLIVQRNPSLLIGSAQKLNITRFKTDITDLTLSISILITAAMNADSNFI